MVKRSRPSERQNEESDQSDSSDEALEDMIAAGVLTARGGKSNVGTAVGAGAGGGFVPSRHVNDTNGLRRAFEEVRQDLPWIDRLEVVSADPLGVTDVKDDLKLELAFYGQALASVVAARSEFDRVKIPHRRPDDYFAEMLKSDSHMARIKGKLVGEAQRMSAVETRKNEKESAGFHKAAAAEKTKLRAQEKRDTLDAVKRWRRNKDSRTELSNDKDLDTLFNKGGAGGGGGGGAGAGANKFAIGKKPKPGANRRAKDRKFGHGGPKHFLKENTAKSTGDMRGFSSKGMKSKLPPGVRGTGAGGGAGGGGGGKKPHKAATGGARPGKWARSAGKRK